MSTQLHTLNFTAPGMLPLPQGRFLLIKSAAAAVNISAKRRDGQPENLNNVGAGLKYNALERGPWYSLEVTSAVIQVVEIVISDEAQVDFSNLVSVAGNVVVTSAPTATFATPADQTLATATSFDIAANPTRRAIVIGSLSTNAPATQNLRVRDQAGVTSQGIELQPGTFVRVATTAALRVRNNDANSQTIWYFEE